MQERLHLRLIQVLSIVVDALDELVDAVRCSRSWSRCPHCGFACRRFHDVRARRSAASPVTSRPVSVTGARMSPIYTVGGSTRRYATAAAKDV